MRPLPPRLPPLQQPLPPLRVQLQTPAPLRRRHSFRSRRSHPRPPWRPPPQPSRPFSCSHRPAAAPEPTPRLHLLPSPQRRGQRGGLPHTVRRALQPPQPPPLPPAVHPRGCSPASSQRLRRSPPSLLLPRHRTHSQRLLKQPRPPLQLRRQQLLRPPRRDPRGRRTRKRTRTASCASRSGAATCSCRAGTCASAGAGAAVCCFCACTPRALRWWDRLLFQVSPVFLFGWTVFSINAWLTVTATDPGCVLLQCEAPVGGG